MWPSKGALIRLRHHANKGMLFKARVLRRTFPTADSFNWPEEDVTIQPDLLRCDFEPGGASEALLAKVANTQCKVVVPHGSDLQKGDRLELVEFMGDEMDETVLLDVISRPLSHADALRSDVRLFTGVT